VTNIYIFLCY